MNDRGETQRRIRESLFDVLARDGLALERDSSDRRWRALCPFHAERTASFKVWDDGNWYCFGCGFGGDAADYVARRYGLDRRSDFAAILVLLGLRAGSTQRVAQAKVARPTGPPPPPPSPLQLEAVYDYQRADGKTLYQVRRYRPKTFRMFAADGAGGWRPGMKGVYPLLYRLPDVLAAASELAIAICEGEKDVDRAWELSLPATCNSGGAGNWPDGMAEYLRGRTVYIIPDNDDAGRRHAHDVATALHGVATAVAIVTLPGLAEHGDFSDWLAAGHTLADLDTLCAAAVVWDGSRELSTAHTANENGNKLPALRGAASVTQTAPAQLYHDMRLSEVQGEPVRWLWPGYIAFNELTVIDGDPGLGKSAITLDLAARVSSGAAMPLDTRGDLDEAAGVELLSCENDLGRTVQPRLVAAGARLGQVFALDLVFDSAGQRLPTLLDVAALEQAIVKNGVKLVIIDPLMAYLPSDVNSFRDQDVRRVLTPLAELAKRTGVAIVVVRHLNKTAGNNPVYRGGGSIGISGAARVVLLVAADPADPTGERRILAQIKNNLAPLAPALAFRLAAAAPDSMRVAWEGPTSYTARALLAEPKDEGAEPSSVVEAQSFLCETLAEGPLPTVEVERKARQFGIARRTLHRAKAALGITSAKGDGAGAGWLWTLPEAG